jgi:hypothetical protein
MSRVPQAAGLANGPPATSPVSCGPDITDWFLGMLNGAPRDGRVLEVKRRLEAADRVGARYGYSAADVLEGGLVRKVLAAERAAGNPPRTAAAAAQIAAADPRNQFGRALLLATAPIPFAGAPEHAMLAALKGAAEIWKSLVETGADFDFKNTVLAKANLDRAGCPPMAPGDPTVTILGTCYENDLPGNIFYAYVSKFCGFSRTAVHLGSQWAELQDNSSKGWDSPEDTAALNLGYDLPPGLITPAILGGALRAAGRVIRVRPCAPCANVFVPGRSLLRM